MPSALSFVRALRFIPMLHMCVLEVGLFTSELNPTLLLKSHAFPSRLAVGAHLPFAGLTCVIAS